MKKTQTKNSAKRGFTIVEVTIVTAFVAMLLITITVIATNISAIFQKGLTLNGVNTVGRNLISEFTSAINAAPSIDTTSFCNMYLNEDEAKKKCVEDNAFRYIFQTRTGTATDTTVSEGGTEEVDVQYFGIFCSGTYTYMWNTYYGTKAPGNNLKLTYLEADGGAGTKKTLPEGDEPFRLLRFEDKTYRACAQNVKPNDYTILPSVTNVGSDLEIDVTKLENDASNPIPTPRQGFLESSESDINLDLYEFVIFPLSQDVVTLRAFFAGTFILATNNGDVNIMRSGDYCDPGGGTTGNTGSLQSLASGFNYCGINRFNFAARTAGNKV